VVTADTVAVNAALVAPAATVTDAGTVTDELLLDRFTPNPPVGAAAVSVAVQASVAAPVSELAVQLTALSAANTVLSCRAKVFVTPLADAVSVAVCAVVTADAVAVKAALVAPAATVTDAGTFTDELLLDRLTVEPPLDAAAVSVTVQASVAAPVSEPAVHFTALSAAGTGFSCR
jgi:hypothetical protein